MCTVASGTDVGSVEPLSWVGIEHSKKVKDETLELTSVEIGGGGGDNTIDGSGVEVMSAGDEDVNVGGLFGELFV